MSQDKVSAEILVTGRVQGVGYRFFTERIAADLGVCGWSMNMPDGTVKLEIEARRNDADRFIAELKKGPSMARVSDVSVQWKPFEGKHTSFFIRF